MFLTLSIEGGTFEDISVPMAGISRTNTIPALHEAAGVCEGLYRAYIECLASGEPRYEKAADLMVAASALKSKDCLSGLLAAGEYEGEFCLYGRDAIVRVRASKEKPTD